MAVVSAGRFFDRPFGQSAIMGEILLKGGGPCALQPSFGVLLDGCFDLAPKLVRSDRPCLIIPRKRLYH